MAELWKLLKKMNLQLSEFYVRALFKVLTNEIFPSIYIFFRK